MATLAVVAVSGQRYEEPSNGYREEYADYESPRPAHPTPRSYAPAQAPAQRAPAPAGPKPTPVAILKQINRHNEDGSYTYGFEGGDGSFKIETKLPTGEVKGKYGFVDDTGKVRVVEYGANKYGFQPSGEGITVAPPTLVDETTGKDGLHNANSNYQDYNDYQAAAPAPAPVRPQIRPTPQAASLRQQEAYERSQYQPAVQQQQYQPPRAHTQAVYAPQQSARARVPAPAPQRPIFAQAAPAPLPQSRQELGYSAPRQQAYAPRPAPVHQQQSYDEPEPIPQQYSQQGPVQFAPAPHQSAPRPQPQARSQGGGILDQLARDYALPQGGAAPLHDISFGYY